jgi:hypothetical protein
MEHPDTVFCCTKTDQTPFLIDRKREEGGKGKVKKGKVKKGLLVFESY